ncbi:MAG: hypothetical protein K0R23_177 [Lacrimispora sp.]|jgi:hypothetical protein|nr:hypothetical protein [Lacrimispora sp.]
MGQYNKAILTAAGENLIARALAGEIQLHIIKAKTSNHIYPTGTDFKLLTDLQGIKQAASDPATTVYNDTMIQTRALFSNETIESTYYIHNIGLYAVDGTEEILFCIVTAEIPDEMPQYNGVASTSYIYNIQNVVQDAAELNITVNPSGTATIQDVLERVDISGGNISETVIETLDTVEDKYPIPAAGESVKRFFGKVLTFMKSIRPLTGDVNTYVSTTGSDTTGDGTSAKPYRTIQHAINSIPKDLGGYTVIITVSDGTYPEDIMIRGFGNGIFHLLSSTETVLSDNCKINSIYTFCNTCSMAIGGFSIMTTSDVGINVNNCASISLQFIKITGNALSSGKYGITLYRCIFSVWNCQVSYRTVALFAYNSHGVSNNWATCTGNTYGLYSSYGAVITTTGTQPAANTLRTHDSGGMFTYDNGTQISDLITSGLSCTWGTIQGGYYRNGNSKGVAEVTLGFSVTITTQLTANQNYAVSGIPQCAIPIMVASCSDKASTKHCYVTNSGTFIFNPSINIGTGNNLIFGGSYITNS